MTISSYTSDRTAVNAASRDPFQRELLKRAIQLAYEEDFGAGHPIDLTTQAVAGPQLKANAVIYCKQSGVYVSGLSILGDVFRYLEPKTEIELLIEDGAYIDKAPYPVARISGYAFAVLGAERIALNLLQRMSGITTMTRQFVERAAGHGIAILDTRKTTPGLRVFERYAVIVGGGVNHRFGLNEKILLKDNHIQIAGGVAGAIKAVRKA